MLVLLTLATIKDASSANPFNVYLLLVVVLQCSMVLLLLLLLLLEDAAAAQHSIRSNLDCVCKVFKLIAIFCSFCRNEKQAQVVAI